MVICYRKIQDICQHIVRSALIRRRRADLVAYHNGATCCASLHRDRQAVTTGHQDHHADHRRGFITGSRRAADA